MKAVAIIAARGGSKGIPGKNIIDFCGKPLIAWSIEAALAAPEIDSVWVTSDCPDIRRVSEEFGAKTVLRPEEISGDIVAPEPAWTHALDQVEKEIGKVDLVTLMQVTSPLRRNTDISDGIKHFLANDFDSLFSASKIDDMFFWEKGKDGNFQSINYDYLNRKRRQDFTPQYVENGSYYVCKPYVLREFNNRLGGKIGISLMEFWQMFEIDTPDDLNFCKMIMDTYVLKNEVSK